MMAVLKAGGACVHLGATQPIARLAQIVLDSGTKVLLADPQHSEIFQDLVEVITIAPEFLKNYIPEIHCQWSGLPTRL